MGLITNHYYCNEHHDNPISSDASCKEKMKSKCMNLFSRIVSHAYVTGKTIAAHPLTTALLVIAFITTNVAGAALLGTGFIIPGAILLGLAFNIGVIGASIFVRIRTTVDAEEYKKAHSLENMQNHIQKDQKICLVIETTHDRFGAFSSKGPKKWEKKYPVIHVKVSNIQEMQRAIEEVSKVGKIQVLWLAAHGNWNRVVLGKNSSQNDDEHITIYNIGRLGDALSKLETSATIVCNACKTAKEAPQDRPNDPNFAKKLSEVAVGCTVIAPTVNISRQNLFLKGGKKPKIGMQMHKLGFCANILDVATPNFIGKCFRDNVMRVYKDGVLQDSQSYVRVDQAG